MLELAEKFAHDKKPQRSLAFAFWTLEEQGLLGSEYFGRASALAAQPYRGRDQPGWRRARSRVSRNMEAAGTGQSELEDVLKDALATQDRVLSPDPEPEKGHFYRSDHFSLAQGRHSRHQPRRRPRPGGGRQGGRPEAAPTIMSRTAITSPATNGAPTGTCRAQRRIRMRYYIAGDTLANSDRWPNYYKDSEFRALRDKDMAGKK